jgi:hypothetical protein
MKKYLKFINKLFSLKNSLIKWRNTTYLTNRLNNKNKLRKQFKVEEE